MRKSILIFGIIMAFIIGSIVTVPSVAAPTGGAALLAEQVAEIKDIIRKMQDELNNLHVPWGNVTGKPVGFANATNPEGIFQNSTSTIAEPCNVGDVVTWNGTHWVCDDIGGGASNVVVLYYEQRALETVPPTTRAPIIMELAVWEIVKARLPDGTIDLTYAHDVSMLLFETTVYGSVKQTSSGSRCFCVQTGWFKSQDATFSPTGMHWEEIEVISARTGIFVEKSSFDQFTDLRSRFNFIAFGTTNPNDGINTSAGEVKDFSGTMTIHLTPGKSLVRIL